MGRIYLEENNMFFMPSKKIVANSFLPELKTQCAGTHPTHYTSFPKRSRKAVHTHPVICDLTDDDD